MTAYMTSSSDSIAASIGTTLMIGSRADPASINLVESLLRSEKCHWESFSSEPIAIDDDSGISADVRNLAGSDIYRCNTNTGGTVYLWMVEQRLLTLNFADRLFKELLSVATSASATKQQWLASIDHRYITDIVFLSRHQAASGKLSLTVHPIGVPWMSDTSEVGGLPGRCSPPSPHIAPLYRSILKKTKLLGLTEMFDVTMEATHHGPFVELPVCFVEIGSTESEWSNTDAGAAWADCLADYFHLSTNPTEATVNDDFDIVAEDGAAYNWTIANQTSLATTDAVTKRSDTVAVISIGGGHYVPKMNDVARYGLGMFTGHSLTTYAMQPHLNMHEEYQRIEESATAATNEVAALADTSMIEGGWKAIINEAVNSTRKSFPKTKIVCLVDKKAFSAAHRNLIVSYIEEHIKVDWTYKSAEVKKLYDATVK